jgi:hypothetical protein
MKVKTLLRGCSLALAVAAAAHAQGSPDGKWVGKTAQGEAVSFEIQDGALISFTLGWRIPLDAPCATSPGSPLVITVLGGTDTLFFPYTQKEFDLLKSKGETRIDSSTVAPTVGKKGFEVNRELSGKARLSVIATPQPDGSLSGTAKLIATSCKGAQELSWSAHKEK